MKPTVNASISLFAVLLAVLMVSCSDKMEEGTLSIDNDEIILPAKGDSTRIAVSSTLEWRIDFAETSWLKSDVMGGQPARTYFTLITTDNNSDSERFCDLTVYEGNDSVKAIKVRQLSRYPFISPATQALDLFPNGGDYQMRLSMNVPETDIKVSSDASWIDGCRIMDGVLYFTAKPNTENLRTDTIRLEYTDSYDRKAVASIAVSQPFSQYAGAEEISFDKAKAYKGSITDKVCVKGTLVANGASDNMSKNRYILQDTNGNTLLFQSEKLIPLDRFNQVEVALTDGEVTEEKEGHFTYKVIKGITTAHILSSEKASFTPPVKSIRELTSDMVFSLVTLRDVEIASPHGAFTNFVTTDPGSATRAADPYYWVKLYPAYYRWYPTCIRDANGSHIYMLTSLNTSYAHETLPTGSGTITGIVDRVRLSNFGITEDELSIIPLDRSDISLSTVNSVSDLLVEWDCNIPASVLKGGTLTVYHPTGGLTTESAAVLSKDGNIRFQQWYTDNVLGFQDDYRGDVNLTNTNPKGGFGRVTQGAFNSKPWKVGSYFYVDKISTKGISGRLSLQVEMNTSWGGAISMHIEYATSMGGPWTKLDNSEFKVLGEFDRSMAAGRSEKNIPGYRVYDFLLPASLSGKDNICLKIVADESKGPVRLANLSIRYNK